MEEVLTPAAVLSLFVRHRNAQAENLIQITVLAGSAPFAVRSFFGNELGALLVVHIAAVLAASTGIGYLLAEFVRVRMQMLLRRRSG